MKLDQLYDTSYIRNTDDVKFFQEECSDVYFNQTKIVLDLEDTEFLNSSFQMSSNFQYSHHNLNEKSTEENFSNMLFNRTNSFQELNHQLDYQYIENENLPLESQIPLNDDTYDNSSEFLKDSVNMFYNQQSSQSQTQENKSSSPLSQSVTSQIPSAQSNQFTQQISSDQLVDLNESTEKPKKQYTQDHVYKGVFQRICVLSQCKPKRKSYKTCLVEKIAQAIKYDDSDNLMILQIAQTYNKKKCEYMINFILNMLKTCKNYIDIEHPSVIRAVKSIYNSVTLKLMKL